MKQDMIPNNSLSLCAMIEVPMAQEARTQPLEGTGSQAGTMPALGSHHTCVVGGTRL